MLRSSVYTLLNLAPVNLKWGKNLRDYSIT